MITRWSHLLSSICFNVTLAAFRLGSRAHTRVVRPMWLTFSIPKLISPSAETHLPEQLARAAPSPLKSVPQISCRQEVMCEIAITKYPARMFRISGLLVRDVFNIVTL